MDIEVTNSPELSVGEPPSVPSRISVVLVEEAKAGGTPRLGCPRVDQDIWLLAGVAKPASVTVNKNSHKSPCVGGTLSSSDIAGRLLPVVPAGIPFPVGPVDPAGPYVAGGPVGPYGNLSPSDSEPAGSVGPYVAGGPVGPDGTLSRCPRLSLTRMARMLQLALWAHMGHCPHLTLNLLALSARMLQVALLAQMGRCPHLSLTLLAQMAVCCSWPCGPVWDTVPI